MIKVEEDAWRKIENGYRQLQAENERLVKYAQTVVADNDRLRLENERLIRECDEWKSKWAALY
jgi:regulator of replication initiation timing